MMKRWLIGIVCVLVFGALGFAQSRVGVPHTNSPAGVDLYSNQTANGNKTWAADSGIAGSLSVGSTVTSKASSGNNAFAVSSNGARVDFGAGANDYASSDGTTVTYAGAVTVNSTMTVASGGQLVVAADTINFTNTLSNLYFNNTAAGAGVITSNISAANAGSTASTAMLKFYPQQALDSTDWVFSLGTVGNAASIFSVSYAGTATANGSTVATAANGVAGGSMWGYVNLGSAHAVTALSGTILPRALPSGNISLAFVPQTAGTVGGTLTVKVLDVTSSTTIATSSNINCTSSSGGASQVSVSAAAAGDSISLEIDTSSCTGVDPIGTASAVW